MRVLVSGATGFLGSSLCRALVRQGHTVRALHRATSPLGALHDLPLERVVGDVMDPACLDRAMDGIEVVFHTAAQMGRWGNPEQATASHVLGTRHVLQAARRAGVSRVIHTSSVAALGVPDPARDEAGAVLMDEHHVWNYAASRWPYGHAKHLAEQEVARAVAAGMWAVIVNPAWVVGPGDVHRVRSSLVWHAARGKIPVSVTGGLNVVHIDDVTAGHLAALARGRCGERYILGGENLNLSTVLRIAAEAAGRRPPRWKLPAGMVRRAAAAVGPLLRALSLPVGNEILQLAGRYFYYDTRKARDELGIGVPRPFRQAVDDALAWYRKAGLL